MMSLSVTSPAFGDGETIPTKYTADGAGISPPPGPAHRYQFRLYALDAALGLKPGATQAELEVAMDGTIMAMALLEGLYGR